MTELIIGASGFIGSALAYMVPDAIYTSSREGVSAVILDLREVTKVPPCDVAYICGGANGAWKCENDPIGSFAENVDGPIEVARIVTGDGGFAVYIGSQSVEWQTPGAYQRQKMMAETVLRAMPGVGIVRAGRVTIGNRDDLCRTILRVGRNRIAGVTRWGTDAIAYDK